MTKTEYLIYNLLSVVLLLVFIVLEILYLNFVPNHNFDTLVNGFPNTIFVAKDTIDDNKPTDSDVHVDEVASKSEIELEQIPNGNFGKNYKLSTVSEAYFENALFVGDSRMLGFSIYKKIEGATYYCYQSADAFTILDKEYELEPYGMISLYNLLSIKNFDKIYISLGINNVAAGIENHRKHYKHLLDAVLTLQPNAIVYLLGNLHITSELKSDMPYLNNESINIINTFIKEFEDGYRIFYLDPNVVYDDEFGNMDSELSYDNAHIFLRHYDRYLDFLLTHAVVFE